MRMFFESVALSRDNASRLSKAGIIGGFALAVMFVVALIVEAWASRPIVYVNPNGACVHIEQFLSSGRIQPQDCGWEIGEKYTTEVVSFNWRPNRRR